jgi:multidrug efflux pump subunit AcrB
MVTDPIFQGLGMAMISGAVVSTALTLVAVPLLYYELQRNRRSVPNLADHT